VDRFFFKQDTEHLLNYSINSCKHLLSYLWMRKGREEREERERRPIW